MGKKSGPLAFLNKKTWHPGRIQNLEEVWKRQQEAGKEEEKLKEYAKQLKEERAREELASIAEAGGHKIKGDRLDWMYQGGLVARQEADQRIAAQEAATAATTAAATSDAPPPAAESLPPGGPAPAPALPSFYSEDTPASANEMWQRLHADPLFAIKQQELAARRNIVANPVRMMEIKQQVKELKQLAGGKKEKKHKKEKKEKKEKKHKRDRSPSSDSGAEAPAPAAAAKRLRSASPAGHAAVAATRPEPAVAQQRQQQQQQQRETPREPPRGRDAGERHERYSHGGRRYDDAARRPAAGADGRRLEGASRRERSRSRSRGRGGGGGYGRERFDSGRVQQQDRGRDARDSGRERERERERDAYRRRSRSRSRDRSRERAARRRDEGGARDSRAPVPAAPAAPDAQQQRDGGSARGQPAAAAASAEAAAQVPVPAQPPQVQVQVHMDGASAQAKSAKYGIDWASRVPEEARQADRSDFAEASRKRLEAAARAKEAEEREKAAQRYQRKEYRTGKLTDEEKAKRLAEMMGNAEQHDSERQQRLKSQAEKEAAEAAEEGARHHTDTASFLQTATKDVYGTTKGGSLEDTVGRRAYFNDRSGSAAAFKKG